MDKNIDAEKVEENTAETAIVEPTAEETTPLTPPAETAEAEKWKALSRKNEEAKKQLLAEKIEQEKTLAELNQRLADFEKQAETALTLEQQLQVAEREKLALQVALEQGIPAVLASRLQGSNREELENDALNLKDIVKTSKSVDTGTRAENVKPALNFQMSKIDYINTKFKPLGG